ncbi:MarR family transcriptional regulator [Streptomyces sp. SID7499]|uniref:MarR family transcriptional regulator n=1 Tax=Streptomyces sp. SID7499 TaxID=2706086 RepID=A0A6G3XST0_9ACTN|nr:MarR family transcriptional regulator [Streptomyces sp. SID7499]
MDVVLGHTMFEVLIRLCRHPDVEISQRRLADDLTLTRSGITRLVDRMEGSGLVRRVAAPGDRRSVLVESTDHGRAVFLQAAAAHAQVVERYFVAPLASLGEIEKALRDD